MQEREADRAAIMNAGVSAKDAISCFKKIYYPDTADWPLYAKMMYVVQWICYKVSALPVLRDYFPHLNFNDRIKDLTLYEHEKNQKNSALEVLV